MTVQVPTASDLKARYPEFTGVADATVTAVIAEASPMVDEGWETSDQKPAIMAFTAHLLAMEGYPQRSTNVQAPIKASVGREVLSRKVGDVSTQYAQTNPVSASAGLTSQLSLTPYGRRFLQLLKLNAPAIGLV